MTRYTRKAKGRFRLRTGDALLHDRKQICDRTLEGVRGNGSGYLEVHVEEMEKDAVLSKALPFFRAKLSDKLFVVLLVRHRKWNNASDDLLKDPRIHRRKFVKQGGEMQGRSLSSGVFWDASAGTNRASKNVVPPKKGPTTPGELSLRIFLFLPNAPIF
jgi:hypothetical protein